ncbi:MAG: hypothetical protein AB7P20_29030 [Rhizobiaceae bacterium]
MLKLSRAELHELVWSKPMTEIAREFGVRDQHLAQICDSHDVARPPTGHWQKVQYGKTVQWISLATDRFAPSDIVVIHRRKPGLGRPARV